jgi:hypothetical protein
LPNDRGPRCPSCQVEAAPAQKFCSECGTRLVAACPACGQPTALGQKFCAECGTALAPGAASRSPMDAGARHASAGPSAAAFIEEAGRFKGAPVERAPARTTALRDTAPVAYTPKHLADKILRSRAASEGERKQVTVMFADVSGFTAMSSRLDPEDVHDIMDRTFEVITQECSALPIC